jgi:hypothetical protein
MEKRLGDRDLYTESDTFSMNTYVRVKEAECGGEMCILQFSSNKAHNQSCAKRKR